MKMDIKKLGDQAIKSTTTSTKMRLSEDASSMVFQLFTKNVYSNPKGTVVREITSNCFDSHVEAGVNKPVVIRKHKDEETGTSYISFIDFGVGMSPDRVENIYGVYFESTKRVDNTQIGGFGIGGKTPLAYKRSTGQGEGEYDNSFYVITVFDKMKYWYCIAEGDESPVIHKLHEEATEEDNGTEVQIPVLEKDFEAFQSEMTKQLYYFENIVFEGWEYENYSGDTISPLSNDYQIIRGKNFLFRGDNYDNNMHVCLGRVTYPIDYKTLGLATSDYSLPIALKLEVGDVNVTVSRESLDYSEATIKMLKKKLTAAKDEIKSLITKQYKTTKTLEQYFSVKNEFGQLEFPNGTSLYVGDLIEQKDVDFDNFKYQFLKMPNDKQLFRFFFETKQLGKKPSRSRYSYNSNNSFEGGYNSIRKNDNIVYVEGEWKRKVLKQAWLKDRFTTYYIVSKRKVDDKYMRSEIAELFNVHLDEVVDEWGKPVAFIQELLNMQDEYMVMVRENCENYDTLEVSEEFIASRKRISGMTPELRKTTIPVKFIGGTNRDRVKLSTMFDYNMPIFYGTQDDNSALETACTTYKTLFQNRVVDHVTYRDELVVSRRHSDDASKVSIMFVQLAVGNIKHMKHCKKAYHISEFGFRMMYRKEDIVKQFFQTNALLEKYHELSKFYRKGYINKVSEKWGEKIETIKTFINSIPEEAKNDDIRYQRDRISRYFDLSDIQPTPEQKVIIDGIDEVVALQEVNSETMSFFNLPYELEHFKEEQAMIIELSLTL